MAMGCRYGVSEERVVEMERRESHWGNFTNMRSTRREIGERVEKESVLKLRKGRFGRVVCGGLSWREQGTSWRRMTSRTKSCVRHCPRKG